MLSQVSKQLRLVKLVCEAISYYSIRLGFQWKISDEPEINFLKLYICCCFFLLLSTCAEVAALSKE